MRITWDKFEAALIINMFYRIRAGKIQRMDGVLIVSKRLRSYDTLRGIEIDEKYINMNGILMQLNAVEYADSDGKIGLSSCSKLFKQMVRLYKFENEAFITIFKQAKNIISNEKYNEKILDQEVSKSIDMSMRKREKLVDIVDKSFSYGLKTNSRIALMRFRRFYNDKYNENLDEDDDVLYSEISSFCVEVDGKFFHISAADKKYVDRQLGHIAEKYNLVYYEKFFEIYSEELLEHNIISYELLKVVIDGLIQEENIKKGYFIFESEGGRITEKKCLIDEIYKVWGEAKVRECTYFVEHLPYIPEEKIKYILAQSELFVWNSTEEYTRSDLFVLDEKEKELIQSRARELCEINGSVTFSDLPLETVFNDNYELSETAIFNYIYDYILSGEFSRNGKVIRVASLKNDATELFYAFCREKSYYNIEELFAKWEEITGDNRRSHPLECSFSFLVRINEEEYVSDELLKFDVDKIDEVLDTIVRRKYIGIKEVTSFVAFPDCGYSWNLFLIESYCRRFSKKYKFLTKIASSKNSGAIVEKNMTDDYDEILVKAVAESNVELETDKIFEYLIANGYLYRHVYKGMDKLIYRAKEMRERSI